MSLIRNAFARLIGVKSRLSRLEELILESVKEKLSEEVGNRWEAQIKEINKIQRLPGGVETDFYRMKNGRPTFEPRISFANKTEELLIASVTIRSKENGELTAKVWCVKGFLFSIEFSGGAEYFEEMLSEELKEIFTISCEVLADLSAT